MTEPPRWDAPKVSPMVTRNPLSGQHAAKQPGGQDISLPADAGDDDIVRVLGKGVSGHVRHTSFLAMAPAGQMSAQTPQPAQMISSMRLTFFSLSQMRPGQPKIRVHRRLQPQLSPRQRASSTVISYFFCPASPGSGRTPA